MTRTAAATARARHSAHRVRAGSSTIQRYVHDLYVADAVAASSAAVCAQYLHLGFDDAGLRFWDRAVPSGLFSVVLVVAWLVLQWLGGTYRRDVVGFGTDEYRRVIDVGMRLITVVAVVALAMKADVARGFIVSLIPLAVATTLLGRWWSRRWLHRQRQGGALLAPVLAIGTGDAPAVLASALARSPEAGYAVVETYTIAGADEDEEIGRIVAVARARHVGFVALAAGTGLSPRAMRLLVWNLADEGIEVMVTPQLSDLVAPKLNLRPIAGMSLLHLERPRLSGAARLLKGTVDRLLAAVALVVLAPVLGAIALTVKLTSPGPAFFLQQRVGQGGRWFTIVKFRTMVTAPVTVADDDNEVGGLYFKVRADPRVTPFGRRLRRYSLDELPQFWNVLRGDMSLVGPRPLPDAGSTSELEASARRRVIVKPGITGLWQISGRSDLSWEESIRLDLFYVENWSLTLDAVIVLKTFAAVLRGDGAY
jgi:exopolysaccharide biosynthesis polyprenyl glycosylphosphotransferase